MTADSPPLTEGAPPASPLVGSLVEALQAVPDPRQRRGVRPPCAGMLALPLLGCLCRLSENRPLLEGGTCHAEGPGCRVPRRRCGLGGGRGTRRGRDAGQAGA